MGDLRHGEATEIPGELHPDIPLTPVNLLPLVYNELRTLAGGQLRRERRDHTLQPTALVHEAYMRLARRSNLAFVNRAQFVGIAAREMRRVLVEHARKHKRQKRGGTKIQVPLNEAIVTANQSTVDLVELDDALTSLATRDERSADVATALHPDSDPARGAAHLPVPDDGVVASPTGHDALQIPIDRWFAADRPEVAAPIG